MSMLQLVAKKTSMSYVSIMVPDGAEEMDDFIEAKLSGFEQDLLEYAPKPYSHYEEVIMGLTIYHRCLDPSLLQSKTSAAALAPVAETAATSAGVATSEDSKETGDGDDSVPDLVSITAEAAQSTPAKGAVAKGAVATEAAVVAAPETATPESALPATEVEACIATAKPNDAAETEDVAGVQRSLVF
jgi:hypothetical protein